MQKRDADAADFDRDTTYIVLGIVFGALALVCLFITIYMLARLRRADRKLDRDLAQNVYNTEFAPQFKDKRSFSGEYDYERSAPTTGVPPPSPAPLRPVRRPSSLFDRRRQSNTPKPPTPHIPYVFAQQQQRVPVQASFERSPPASLDQFPMPPQPVMTFAGPDSLSPPPPSFQMPMAPPPSLRELPARPDSIASHYSDATIVPRDREQQLQTAASDARPGFHRSPSLLRKLLHDRTAPPPPPPMPRLPPAPQQQEQRTMVTMSMASALMPYELETASPGPTPIDLPPPTAVPRHATPLSPQEPDPHSAARLTLLQPPAPLKPRRAPPPPLTVHIPHPNTAGTTPGAPPLPVRSPLRADALPKRKPAPLALAPPAPPGSDRQTITPELLAAFASSLRPASRELAAVPVVVHDTEDFRLTMGPAAR